ncbi:MAG: 2Fe-2S iron-sulfur cluster-binding protein, partial [Acidimicrobiales bacterium]
MGVTFRLNAVQVTLDRDDGTLLDALRTDLGIRSVKDGCSPQGQCGCCTVLIDGSPRVSCVTPLKRVAGREVETLEGMANANSWAQAFCDSGGSQCGFCTPGIAVRFEGVRRNGGDLDDRGVVDRALVDHLCRCTGWQTIRESAANFGKDSSTHRDMAAASKRASIESRGTQVVALEVALGQGGFAEDVAPEDALVAVPDKTGNWIVDETLSAALARSEKVQGRRTTRDLRYPVQLAEGDWAHCLQTTWVEPAYLEPDASWCVPGGEPYDPVANGGAFGAKLDSIVPEVARRLANKHGRAVRAVLPRESVVQFGPKRPPIAIAVDEGGSGILRAVTTPGLETLVLQWAQELGLDLQVQQVDVPGPPTSVDIRASIWAELALVAAAVHGPAAIMSSEGALAEATVNEDSVRISLRC